MDDSVELIRDPIMRSSRQRQTIRDLTARIATLERERAVLVEERGAWERLAVQLERDMNAVTRERDTARAQELDAVRRCAALGAQVAAMRAQRAWWRRVVRFMRERARTCQSN